MGCWKVRFVERRGVVEKLFAHWKKKKLSPTGKLLICLLRGWDSCSPLHAVKLEYTTTPADLDAHIYWEFRQPRWRSALNWHRSIRAVVVALGLLLLLGLTRSDWPLGFAVGAISFPVVWWIAGRRAIENHRKAWQQKADADQMGTLIGPHTLLLDDEGITEDSKLCRITFRWPGIAGIKSTADHVFIFAQNGFSLNIPLRALPDTAAREAFLAALHAHHVRAQPIKPTA